MKLYTFLALVGTVAATDHGSTYGGSGPYKSYYFEVETLPNHTFYQPLQSALEKTKSEIKLPVVVWGNGGFGLKFRNFLGEVASWGALAIATGPAFVDPSDYVDDTSNSSTPASGQDPDALTEAIEWVYENAGKGDWTHIDNKRIGVWGQSCGGLEAYSAGAQDDRVHHLGIFNSGQLTVNASEAVASKINKPIFYLLGGPDDVAYPNGERDYADLPQKTPAWKGNHDLGHSAAFDLPNAGIAGITGRHMLQWLLRGDTSSKSWFTGSQATADGLVDVTFQNLDSISVTTIQ